MNKQDKVGWSILAIVLPLLGLITLNHVAKGSSNIGSDFGDNAKMAIYLIDQRADASIYIAKATLFAKSPAEHQVLGFIANYENFASRATDYPQWIKWTTACRVAAANALGIPPGVAVAELTCAAAQDEKSAIDSAKTQKLIDQIQKEAAESAIYRQKMIRSNPGRTCLAKNATELGASCLEQLWRCEDHPNIKGCSAEDLRLCRAPLTVPASWDCPLAESDKKMLAKAMSNP